MFFVVPIEHAICQIYDIHFIFRYCLCLLFLCNLLFHSNGCRLCGVLINAVAVLHGVGGAQEDDTLGGVGAEDAHLTLDGADVHRLQVDAADHLRAYEVVGGVEGGDLRRRFLQPDFGAEVDGDRVGGVAGFLVLTTDTTVPTRTSTLSNSVTSIILFLLNL